MANLAMQVMTDVDWRTEDRVQLRLGSENAASLAASTPAGGTAVVEASPFPGGRLGPLNGPALGDATFGYESPYTLDNGSLYGALINLAPRTAISYRRPMTDKCAVLPVGVRVRDEAGNVSDVVETLVQVRDTPRGARGLTITSTGHANEARLTWTPSGDV